MVGHVLVASSYSENFQNITNKFQITPLSSQYFTMETKYFYLWLKRSYSGQAIPTAVWYGGSVLAETVVANGSLQTAYLASTNSLILLL